MNAKGKYKGKKSPKGKGGFKKDDDFRSDRSRGRDDDFVRSGNTDYGRRVGRFQRMSDPRDTDNDWTWYAFNPALIRDTASFPFGVPLGTRLNTNQAFIDDAAVPGVMAFYTMPTFGQSLDAMSPINMASRDIYSFIRHANSGAANYDSPDLMIYLGAMDSIYAYLEFMKRVYGVARGYMATNRYLPQALLTAMGVDYDDVIAHQADFRAFINTYAPRVASYCIPQGMSFMTRHMWMYSHMFIDSDTDKAQTYLYTPAAFYSFTLDEDGKGMLEYVPFGPTNNWDTGHLLSVKELQDYAMRLADGIADNQDFNIMSGDILKAYGASGIYVPQQIPEAYIVLPDYNTEVASQFENITLVGLPVPWDTTDPTYPEFLKRAALTQVITTSDTQGINGYLQYNPSFLPHTTVPSSLLSTTSLRALSVPFSANRIVNMHHGDVKPEEVMVATRLTESGVASVEKVTGGTNNIVSVTYPSMGSDIAVGARMFTYVYNNNNQRTLQRSAFMTMTLYCETGSVSIMSGSLNTAMTTSNVTLLREQLQSANASTSQEINFINEITSQLSNFDWHPQFQIMVVNTNQNWIAQENQWGPSASASVTQPYGILVDLDNYTILTQQNLQRMSEAALLAQFSIPASGFNKG